MIISISVVSATDMSENNGTDLYHEESGVLKVDSSESDEIVVSNTNDVLGNGESYNFTWLQNKINKSDPVISINLDNDVVSLEGENEIMVDQKAVFIYGNNHIIDANNLHRVFNVKSGAALSLDGVVLVNGKSDYGGAIYNEGTLIIKDNIILNNSASSNGGAIYNNGVSLTINGNTIFRNNKAIGGGAIYNVYSENGFSVQPSVSFENNVAIEYGGAIYSNNNCNVSCRLFENNVAGISGGALYSKGNITVKSSQFNSNTVTGSEACGSAISVINGSLILNDASFISNEATGYGAVYLNNSTYTITSTTFKKNKASYGGAFYFDNILFDNQNVLDDSSFEENNAEQGSAIYITGSNITIIDCNFTGNVAGRGAVYTTSTLNIIDSNFKYNKADEGAALYATGIITIANTDFIGNNATDAGALYLSNVSFINRCIFEGNVAINNGGAIISNLSINITNSNFTNNKANNGALYIVNNNDSYIVNTVFKYNNASNGGAIYYNGKGILNISSSSFINNTATSNGGAIYNSGSNLTVCTSHFENNAANKGGAIYTTSPLILKSNTFTNNTATTNGNAIYTNDKLTLNDNTINKKYADIYVASEGYVSNINIIIMNNSTYLYDVDETINLTANITDINGNLFNDTKFQFVLGNNKYTAVFNETSKLYEFRLNPDPDKHYVIDMYYTLTTANITYNIFKKATFKSLKGTYTDLQNKIDKAGDVLNLTYNFTYDSDVDNIKFPNGVKINKTLTINGNGSIISGNNVYRIFNITAKTTLNNITFTHGNATNGGAIYTTADLTVNNAVFDSNYIIGEGYGSAVYADYSAELNIINSNFTNNYAEDEWSSGTIFVGNKVTIIGSYFANNKAGLGGVIYGDNAFIDLVGQIFIKSSKFENNTANYAGVIYASKFNLSIDNSEFNNNEAVNYGVILITDYSAGVNVSIINSSFDSNKASNQGAVANFESSFEIYGCNFTNNKANNKTSIIYYDCSSQDDNFKNSLIDNCLFKNNTENNYATVYFVGTKNLTVVNSQFINNNASYAGALYFHGKNLIVNSTNFTKNQAKYSGAIYINDAKSHIFNSNFMNNNANNTGAIYIYKSEANITGNNFSNNKAKNVSDAILINQSSLYLHNNKINTKDAEIKNINSVGKITSQLNITVLGNGTEFADDNGNITLFAKITDDMGNLINDPGFKFEINGESISAKYNSTSKQYEINYTFTKLDYYPVNMTYTVNDKLNIKTGIAAYVKGTYTDLQRKIDAAKNNILNLSYNFTYNKKIDEEKFPNGVIINKTLTINGMGYVISGNNTHRIFYINQTANLNNITFNNAYAGKGGAIYSNANITVNNSKFKDNIADYGGAIYIKGNIPDIVANILNTEFENNTAIQGGAIYHENAILKVDNVLFNKNHGISSHNSSVISSYSSFEIKNSNFTSNDAKFNATVIYYNGKATGNSLIDNCRFENNLANYTYGAIYITAHDDFNLTVNNSKFINNIADNENSLAAAVNFFGYKNSNSKLKINNSQFKDNTGSYAGAIYIKGGDVKIINSNFTNNKASKNNGGTIYVDESNTFADSSVEIDNCKFTANTADTAGGAIFINNGTVEVKNSNFTNNMANKTSNSIYLNDGDLKLSKNNISTEVAEIVNNKGLIKSLINITILDAKTVFTNEMKVKLYANISDDNGNLINDTLFNFTIDDNVIKAVYNATSKQYEAEYTLSAIGIYPVNMTYKIMDKLAIQTGNITNIRGTFIDLQNLINENTNGTLDLKYNFTYNATLGDNSLKDILINKTIIINGNGFVINALNSSGIFNIITDNNLTLNNLTLTNANATYGAGVYVDKNAKFIANNVTFINNTATYRGGAIYSQGSVILNNTKFDSNNINISYNNGGAAIFNLNGTLIINNSKFTNNLKNYALNDDDKIGAVITASGSNTILNSVFANNSGYYGADISVLPFTSGDVNLIVDNSNFTNPLSYAGSIFIENATADISNSRFENYNQDNALGGVICAVSSESKLNIVNSTFINNTAPKAAAILAQNITSITISNSRFINNTATGKETSKTKGYGGAILIEQCSDKSIIDNSIFINNTATAGGAVALIDNPVEIKNSNFTNNTARNGSAIYSAGELKLYKNNVSSTVCEIVSVGIITSQINITVLENKTHEVDNLTVKLNATVYDDNGNLIDDKNFNFTIDTKQVRAVYNESSKQYEAIYNLTKPGYYNVTFNYPTLDQLIIKNGTIKCTKGTYTDLQNKIIKAGGELNLTYNFTYYEEIDGENFPNGVNITKDITINGNGYTISGNNTHRIFNITAGAILKNITFTKANATNGGAIYANGNYLTVINSKFINNNAITGDGEGGAIYTNASVNLIDNTIFINNTANLGGAVEILTEVSAIINNSQFENNSANMGGAIFAAQLTSMIINNSTFNENNATGSSFGGGAVFTQFINNLIVNNSQFISNEAYGGGAIRIDNNKKDQFNATILNSLFDSNKGIMGSSILALSGFTLTDCNFTNNVAPKGTATIHYATNPNDNSYRDSSINGCIFENNSAAYYAAIYFYGNKTLTVKDSKFINNTDIASNTPTGAITFQGSKLTVSDCEFIRNTAGLSGAAIAIWAGNATIVKSKFSDNNASVNATAIHINIGANATIKDSTFTNNGNNNDYAIYNLGEMALSNNIISNIIYNNGTITSTVNATFINNKIVNASLGDEVKPNATLKDDNQNNIYDPSFRISVHGNLIENITYDKTTRLYSANYTIINAGDNIVNTTLYKSDKLIIYMGLYAVPKANATLNLTVSDIVYGQNATIQITLTGINSTNITANVTVIINNNETTVEIINGTGSLNVSGLEPNKYPVVVSFGGNSDYNPKINSTVFFVKSQTYLTVNVENIIYGQIAIVNVTLTYGPNKLNMTSGIVVVSISDVEYNIVITNGKGIISIENLEAYDNYNASAVFNQTDYYYTSNASDLFNVSQKTPAIKVTSYNVVYPENVVVTLESNVSGEYLIKIGNEEKTINLTADIPVNVTFSLAASENPYNINVTYTATDTQNYTDAFNDTNNVTVTKANSEVTINPIINVTYPDTITATYTANTILTGIKVTKDGVDVNILINDNNGTITLGLLDAGNYTLTVYVGDENYTYANASSNFTVFKYTPTIIVTADPVTYNEDLVVIVQSDVAGNYTVKVKDETQQIVELEADTPHELRFADLAANYDGYIVIVSYNETDNYNAVCADELAVIYRADAIINITEVTDGVYNTTNTTVNVTLTNTTDVKFNITQAGVEVISGNYSDLKTALAGLNAGNYGLVIYCDESENYTYAADACQFSVDKAKSLITVTLLNNITYGNTFILKFDVSNKTGLSADIINADTGIKYDLGEGEINDDNITVFGLSAGNYLIYIENAEDENYYGDMVNADFTVFKYTPVINVTVSDVIYPGRVVLNVTSDINGTFTAYVGSTLQDVILTAGVAKLVTFSGLDANETGYNVNVTYGGDNNYNLVFDDTKTVKVFKAGSNVVIDLIRDIICPADVEVLYDVQNITNLIVTVKNKETGKEIQDGIVITPTKIIVQGLNEGNYIISINNTGDKNYNASYAEANFSASKYTPVIKVDVKDVIYNDSVIVTVTTDVNGTYTIKVGNIQNTTVILANTPTEIHFNNLNANETGYVVNVTFDSTPKYHSAVNDSEIVKVFKADSSVVINNVVNGIYKTINATVNVTCINTTFITYNITKDGAEIYGSIDNLSKTLAGLPIGDYEITISNAENENYKPSNATATFSIMRAASRVNIVPVDNVTYNTPVNITFSIINATNVLWKLLKDNVEFENGTGIDNFTNRILPAGDYSFIVLNEDNENYTGNMDSIEFTVQKASSNIIINPISNVTYNTKVNINFTVINATNVTWALFKYGDVIQNGEGVENITDLELAAGDYTIVMWNGDNENYTGTIVSLNFSVYKTNSSISFNKFNNVTYGSPLTINYIIENKTEISIDVYTADGTFVTTLDAGDFTDENIVITGLDAGNYYIEVTNAETENITSSSQNAYFTIFKAVPAISMIVANVYYPNNVIVNVKSDASGDYVIKLATQSQDIILKSNETKTATFGGLNAGTYTIEVIYDETANYKATSCIAEVTVFKVKSKVVIDSIINVTFPSETDITYKIENQTTVKITVLDKNGNETPYYMTSQGIIAVLANPGDYTITIENANTSNIEGSQASAKFRINKLADFQFNATSNEISIGENATVDITLPIAAEGIVTVTVNNIKYNATVKGGKATVNIPDLKAGKYNAEVSYSGDDIFTPRTINVNLTVNKAEFTMNASSNSPVYGQNATVNVTLQNDATGNITINVSGKTYSSTVSDGVASVNIDDLAPGDTVVNVTYSGDDKYSSKELNLTIHVKNTVVIADNMIRGYNSGMDYRAKVIDENGNPVSGFTLTFTVNGESYTAITDENGYASINHGLKVGLYTVNVVNPVTGDVLNASLDIRSRITDNSNVNMDYDDGTKYRVRVIGDDGNPVGAGQAVTLTLNDQNYNVLTDSQGYASVTITLAPGTYSAGASYKGDTVSNSIVVKTHFQSKSKVTIKRSKINKKGYFKLKYNVGTYFYGKKVTLKFVNKVYKVKVAKNGYVTFKVSKKVVNKLKVGKKYKYTLTYKLDKKSRNIKVTKTKLIFTS